MKERMVVVVVIIVHTAPMDGRSSRRKRITALVG